MNLRKHFILVIFLSFFVLCTYSVYAGTFLMSADSTVTIYRVQIASRSTDTEAFKIQEQLMKAGITSLSIQSTPMQYWRVYAGPWPTKSEATTTRNQVKALGFMDALIVTTDISIDKANAMNLPLLITPYRQSLINAMNSNSGSIDSVFNQGINLSNASDTKHFESAITKFAEVINRSYNSSQAIMARWHMGQIYTSQYNRTRRGNMLDEPTRRKYLEAAVDSLNDFVNLYPNSLYASQAQKQIGDCLHVLSNYQTTKLKKAATAYGKVINSYPASDYTPDANLQYAGVLFEIAINGEYSWDSVRFELNKIPTLYPQASRSIKARAEMMVAETYYFEKNYSEVISKAQAILKAYSDVTTDVALGHYLMGRAYLEMNQYTLAKPEFNYILNNCQSNSTSDAVEWTLSGFSQLNSKDPMVDFCRAGALLGVSRCYYASGDTTQFQSNINQLLIQYPNSIEARAVKNLWGISTTTVQVLPKWAETSLPSLNGSVIVSQEDHHE